MSTCGDFGGMGEKGPCGLLAGWGTDHRGEGLCKNHDSAAVARLQAIKKSFLDIYAAGTRTLAKAALDAGVDQSTIWRYRQDDEEFDAAVDKLIPSIDKRRVVMVEEAYFHKLATGRASAAEYIFYFTNRAGHRWKHRARLEHTGYDGGPITHAVVMLPPNQRDELPGIEEERGREILLPPDPNGDRG